MNEEDNFPLEFQKYDENNSHPTVYIQYSDIITSIYLTEKDFIFLWFIPVHYLSQAMVGYLNYNTSNRRNNFYREILPAKKAYNDCKEALKEVKDCKLIYEGVRNNAQNS